MCLARDDLGSRGVCLHCYCIPETWSQDIYSVFYLAGSPLRANPNFFRVSRVEVGGLVILWIFWLVGAVDTTVRIKKL